MHQEAFCHVLRAYSEGDFREHTLFINLPSTLFHFEHNKMFCRFCTLYQCLRYNVWRNFVGSMKPWQEKLRKDAPKLLPCLSV